VIGTQDDRLAGGGRASCASQWETARLGRNEASSSSA
jgi:hypothetical protein